MSDKTQWRRWLFIDERIRFGMMIHKYVNCKKLAQDYVDIEGLKISERTFFRDIDFLKYELKAPIQYDKDEAGYYYTDSLYKLNLCNMEEKNFYAILDLEKTLITNIKILNKKLPTKSSFNFLNTDTFSEEHWNLIIDAIRNQNELKIIYQTVNSIYKQRIIQPFKIINQTGQFYLIAYCLSNKKVQFFALSRITSIVHLNTVFSMPDEKLIQKIIKDKFGYVTEDELKVKILFYPEVAQFIKEKFWVEKIEIKENKNNSIEIAFPTRSLTQIVRWVLSWGRFAKVLEPDILIADIKKELEEGYKNYEASCMQIG